MALNFFRAADRISLAKADQALERIEKLNKEKLQAIVAQCRDGMQTAFRRELLVSYSRAGLGNKKRKNKSAPGKLRAAMMRVTADFNNGVWVIRMAPGDEKSLYARAGAHRYGSVRQPLERKKYYKDLITGERRVRKKQMVGVLGERAKRSVKKNVLAGTVNKNTKAYQLDLDVGKGSAGTIHVIAPKKPFFFFQPDQIGRLQVIQQKMVATLLKRQGLKVA